MSPCLPQNCLHIICTSNVCQSQSVSSLSDTTNSQSSTYSVQSYVKCIAGAQQPFVADMLLWKLMSGSYGHKFVYNQCSSKHQYPTTHPGEEHTSVLANLLQHSAYEHLTLYRQLQARVFPIIVTTDAYAYAYTFVRVRCTRTNVATISGVYSCVHRTYARCIFLTALSFVLPYRYTQSFI